MSDYQAVGSYTATLEKQQKSRRRSRLIVILSVLALIVLVTVGVVAGILVSKNNSKEKSGGSTKAGSTGGSTPSAGTVPGTDTSGDPSVFAKDDRLHQSFYGFAYTPEGSLPDYGCSILFPNVVKDIQLLSQLTRRIRLYSSDCNQTGMVLEAIKQTKVDMEVFIGNFVVEGDDTAYKRQRDVIKEMIEKYGTQHIAGITVGNEFMLNYVTGRNSLDANGPVGIAGAAVLKPDIDDTIEMLRGMNLDKHIPVGNSDAGSFFNTQILESVEYGLSNVHAWFANTTAQGASDWVNKFFQEQNVLPAAQLPNKPKMYIAETGWPTDSKDAGNKSNGASDASVANLQIFMDAFVCQANTAGVGYFFFEFSDEEWKDVKYGGVEGHWGVFNKDRTLKDLVIPNCVSP